MLQSHNLIQFAQHPQERNSMEGPESMKFIQLCGENFVGRLGWWWKFNMPSDK